MKNGVILLNSNKCVYVTGKTFIGHYNTYVLDKSKKYLQNYIVYV